MYKLYTDQNESLEAKVELFGASYKECKSRLIVQSGNKALMFEGSISPDGDLKVNIPKLKNLLNEGDSGIMFIEVIVGDRWFETWNSKYEVETTTSIQVEVKTPSKGRVNSKKPKNPKLSLKSGTPQKELSEVLEAYRKKLSYYKENDSHRKIIDNRFRKMFEGKIPKNRLDQLLKL